MQNIMVVEDEAITAMDLQRNLENMGYTVNAVVSTGEDAVKMAEQVTPDLILMDINLDGEIDGTVAAREITGKRNIPIVFLTAFSDDDTLKSAMLPNTHSYLTKPYHEKDLKIALELASYKHKMTQALLAEKNVTTPSWKTPQQVSLFTI
jgi:CheY-like chemotaxis protein